VKVWAPPWQLNAGVAALCASVAGLDAAEHLWWGVPLMTAGAGANVVIGRFARHRQAERRAEAHRPDYAKIARLEVELGLVEPPKPPPAPKPTNTTLQSLIGRAYQPSPQTREILRAPDHRCGLCRPEGPPPGHGCPFYPVCRS
jgi:hypothetical protein